MINLTRFVRPVLGILLLLVLCAAAAAADPPTVGSGARRQGDDPRAQEQPEVPERPKVDPKWLDGKLKKLDRALLDDLIGYAPPAFTEDLAWIGSEPLKWESLRGKVVVIQSWSRKSGPASRMPARVIRDLKDVDQSSLAIIALHTPEGAEFVAEYLEKRPMEMPVIVDARGGYCDSLGVYKLPVNIIVDRQGVVRYAGLNTRGLKAGVDLLVKEKHDPSVTPPAKAGGDETVKVEFPPITGRVDGAGDYRGEVAPSFYAEKWITQAVAPQGRVVLVDFWATWCASCRATIPHMNELAGQFGNQMCFIGLSSESPRDFEDGLRDHDLKERDFHYTLAVDRQARMAKQMRITGIPHVVVLSGDWVVRWQGHPASLSAEILDQIIKANEAASAGGNELDAYRNRWTGQ